MQQQLKRNLNSQEGATLIIVMLVLVAVTAIGITSLNISTIEVNLAGNDKWQKMGFYNADPGLHGTPSVIAPNLNPETEAPLPAAILQFPATKGVLTILMELPPLIFSIYFMSQKVILTPTPPQPKISAFGIVISMRISM